MLLIGGSTFSASILLVIYFVSFLGGCLLTVAGVCRRLLSVVSVTLHGGPAGSFTRTGHAMTSCRLQSNYSSRMHSGPVVLRPVRATPCCSWADTPFTVISLRTKCDVAS